LKAAAQTRRIGKPAHLEVEDLFGLWRCLSPHTVPGHPAKLPFRLAQLKAGEPVPHGLAEAAQFLRGNSSWPAFMRLDASNLLFECVVNSVKVLDKMAHFLDRSQSGIYVDPQDEIYAGVVCGLEVFPQVELDPRPVGSPKNVYGPNARCFPYG